MGISRPDQESGSDTHINDEGRHVKMTMIWFGFPCRVVDGCGGVRTELNKRIIIVPLYGKTSVRKGHQMTALYDLRGRVSKMIR